MHPRQARLRRLPGVVRRLQQARGLAEEFHRTYDAVLTPTVAAQTPLLGHLDPMLNYEEIMERLMAWVAFTPWQNITGQPAVSLPLQTTAQGLPQGMMFGAGAGREGLLLGLAAIQGLNFIRFISLFYLGQYSISWFEFAHAYLWESLIMLDALAVFCFWASSVFRQRKDAAHAS